jgi:hypothetical protein
MRTLYLDCGMGASGDMLLGALLPLQDEPAEALTLLNNLDARLRFVMNPGESGGLMGTRVSVLVDGQEEGAAKGHGHGVSLAEIDARIDALPVGERVREDAKAVYALLAEAEAAAHAVAAEAVHFHEVGMLDAIADIVGVCMLMERMHIGHILASPVHVGFGTVPCAHGELPVPAPATAHLLMGIPIYGGEVRGELCTPTGAALLKHFVAEFSGMPCMRVARIGCGLGQKSFSRPNALRAFLGEEEAGEGPNDEGVELSCNLDDMTGEQMGFALERLMEAGARDVCFVPVMMKKGRPAYRLICQCAPADTDKLAILILKHSTSFGVQRVDTRRYILNRRIEARETPHGAVRYKVGTGYGVCREKAEYADMAELAKKRGESLADALIDHGGADL